MLASFMLHASLQACDFTKLGETLLVCRLLPCEPPDLWGSVLYPPSLTLEERAGGRGHSHTCGEVHLCDVNFNTGKCYVLTEANGTQTQRQRNTCGGRLTQCSWETHLLENEADGTGSGSN